MKIKPGLHFQHPSLEELDQGDLIHRCDFRRVYAAVLRDWLHADHQRILGGNFSPLKIIKQS